MAEARAVDRAVARSGHARPLAEAVALTTETGHHRAMLKWFTVIAIAVFLWWRIQSWREARRRRALGLPPETRRVRPITVLAVIFLVFYGGYLAWFLITGEPIDG